MSGKHARRSVQGRSPAGHSADQGKEQAPLNLQSSGLDSAGTGFLAGAEICASYSGGGSYNYGIFSPITFTIPEVVQLPFMVKVTDHGSDDGIALNGHRLTNFSDPRTFSLSQNSRTLTIAGFNDGGPSGFGATVCYTPQGFFIGGQLTSLDSNGNGTWNGHDYSNGIVTNFASISATSDWNFVGDVSGSYSVSASGSTFWAGTGSGDPRATPDGIEGTDCCNSCNILSDVKHMTLIGRINGGAPFRVGSSFSGFGHGRLELRVNDTCQDDNGGSFSLSIQGLRAPHDSINRETFTASDGTLLSSHSTSSFSWTSQYGTAAITGNEGYFSSLPYLARWDIPYGLTTFEGGTSNGIVGSKISWGDNGYGYGAGYLIFRFVDMNNYMIASSDYVSTNCAKFNIVSVINGTATELASTQTQAACLGGKPGQTGQIEVTLNGSAISAKFSANSTSTFTYTLTANSDHFLNATKHGFASIWSNTRWDDFYFNPSIISPVVDTGSAEACDGDCYTGAQDLDIGTERQGPNSTTLTLQYANASNGFKIWKEKDGTRILNATGLVANGWQKQLTRAGTGFSETDFTTAANIAGRVCPTHVFLSHISMTTTGRCLYYDSGNTAQTLDNAGTSGTEASDWLQHWTRADTGRGTGSSYYEGNIKTCADKGMRLPTIYETTANKPTHTLPTGDSITPTWAGANGVPSYLADTWTASARTNYTQFHWYWSGTTSHGYYYSSSIYVRCVLPDNAPDTPPGAPTSLRATVGDTQVPLTWSAPVSNGGASLTDYVVQYSLNSGTDWTLFSDGTSTATSTTVTGLTNGVAYIFRVAATNSVGTGEYSQSVTITPGALPTIVRTGGQNDFTGDGTSANPLRSTLAYETYTFQITNAGTLRYTLSNDGLAGDYPPVEYEWKRNGVTISGHSGSVAHHTTTSKFFEVNNETITLKSDDGVGFLAVWVE